MYAPYEILQVLDNDMDSTYLSSRKETIKAQRSKWTSGSSRAVPLLRPTSQVPLRIKVFLLTQPCLLKGSLDCSDLTHVCLLISAIHRDP
jgi:hypothetical protein